MRPAFTPEDAAIGADDGLDPLNLVAGKIDSQLQAVAVISAGCRA